jgi:hypothetical protein
LTLKVGLPRHGWRAIRRCMVSGRCSARRRFGLPSVNSEAGKFIKLYTVLTA